MIMRVLLKQQIILRSSDEVAHVFIKMSVEISIIHIVGFIEVIISIIIFYSVLT